MAHVARLAAHATKSFLLKDISETKSKFFLRIEALDKQGFLLTLQVFLETMM